MTRAALVLLACAACSDNDSDGPIVDGHGDVTVRVTARTRPVPSATVVFHGPGGNVLGTAITDASGTARGELDTPGMVTIVDPEAASGGIRRLVTVTHVTADELIEVPLERERSFRQGESIGTLTVAAPASPPPAGTDHYEIHMPCGTEYVTTLPATIALYAGCTLANMPVVVMPATPNRSLEDPGYTLAYVAGTSDANGTFAPGAWSTTCGQVDIKTDPVMALNLLPRFGGHVFHHVWPGFCAPAAPPPGYTAYPILDLSEGALAFAYAYVSSSLRTTGVLADYPMLPEQIAIDGKTDLLVGDAELTRFDGAGARWTSDVTLGIADVVIADLTWSLGTNEYVAWRFVLPNGAHAVVPTLPAAVETWRDLASANERILELRFMNASWTDELHVLHGELSRLLETRTPPPRATLHEYVEQFYPDAGN